MLTQPLAGPNVSFSEIVIWDRTGSNRPNSRHCQFHPKTQLNGSAIKIVGRSEPPLF
jgi:hypothetical protein